MVLHTDEQTIADLGIFGQRNSGGIYDLYNRTHTRGGEAILKELFLHPLSDKAAINRRSNIIENFSCLKMAFPFNAALIDITEKYLRDSGERTKNTRHQSMLSEKEIQHGVLSVIELIQHSREFIETTAVKDIAAYAAERQTISLLIADPAFEPALREKGKGKLSYTAIAAYDTLFRVRERPKIEQLLGQIYYLDVYVSVAKV